MPKLPGFTAGFSLGATIPAAPNSRTVRSRYKYICADSVEAAMDLCYEMTIECGPFGCRSHCDDNYPHGGGGAGDGGGIGVGGGGNYGGGAQALDPGECFDDWRTCLRFCENSPDPELKLACQLGCDAVYGVCLLLPYVF